MSSKRKPKGDKPEPNPQIWVNSIVSSKTLEPWVTVEWGERRGQLRPDEARAHAVGVLEAANAAESDAFVMEVLMKDAALSLHTAFQALVDFRAWRTSPRTKRALVSAPAMEKAGTDALRRHAGNMLVMAEMADAQAFLIGFLTDRLGLDDARAGAIAQKYAEYYERRKKMPDTVPPEKEM